MGLYYCANEAVIVEDCANENIDKEYYFEGYGLSTETVDIIFNALDSEYQRTSLIEDI